MKKVITEIIHFGWIGITCTLINILIQLILLNGFQIPLYIGLVIGFLISSVVGYYLNSKVTFKQEKMSKETLTKFYLSYSFIYIVLGWVLTFIGLEVFQMSQNLVPFFCQIIQMPTSFIMNKVFVFKNKN